jgi:hypothetical protein
VIKGDKKVIKRLLKVPNLSVSAKQMGLSLLISNEKVTYNLKTSVGI